MNSVILDIDAKVGNSDALFINLNPYETIFSRKNDDLVIAHLNNDQSLSISGWYLGADHHIESISGAGYSAGNPILSYQGTISDAQVEGLVSAMSGFKPVAGQREFTQSSNSFIVGAIERAWTISAVYDDVND